MKIYTKTGDSGQTSLVTGTRVEKCHPRVTAYGDADELNSWLGLLRTRLATDANLEDAGRELLEIQGQLMHISALLACDCPSQRVSADDLQAWTAFLEDKIDAMTAALVPQRTFLIPGPPEEAAMCHIARTICRRCERSIVAIPSKTTTDEPCARYVNRLSDYLFTLARYVCETTGTEEDKWLP